MSPEDAELLARLAAMPFLDRLELAALSGRSRSAVFRRVAAMQRSGLLESFVHSSEGDRRDPTLRAQRRRRSPSGSI